MADDHLSASGKARKAQRKADRRKPVALTEGGDRRAQPFASYMLEPRAPIATIRRRPL